MATWSLSKGSARSALSMVRVTSAKPWARRWGVPPKMTSSILEQRRERRDCSPSTQRMASLILLLPLP